ncbi:hypothetical protein EDB92DRAFT_2078898 [Lactarius akahatsu]|uniref:Uncharacterized protein n=1 Tax=Lactarius akahatsu TaxID=416441 RepID=A0AAD4LV37_9AGAM|nr:hypothetical protein EDB92DRAFT_2078898 [Lactarius akahatsu]
MSTIKKDSVWKDKEAGEEAQYARQKEQKQLASLRAQGSDAASHEAQPPGIPREDRDYEAGFGGQEDLEDRYATTSGEN